MLADNICHRLESLGAWPHIPVVICGYGASSHGEQWIELIDSIRKECGYDENSPQWKWAPCGHFLPEPKEPLRRALQEFKEAGERQVAIIPLFLAISSYQIDLVPFVIAEYPMLEVFYRPDAILPDPGTEKWVVNRIEEWLANPNP